MTDITQRIMGRPSVTSPDGKKSIIVKVRFGEGQSGDMIVTERMLRKPRAEILRDLLDTQSFGILGSPNDVADGVFLMLARDIDDGAFDAMEVGVSLTAMQHGRACCLQDKFGLDSLAAVFRVLFHMQSYGLIGMRFSLPVDELARGTINPQRAQP